MSITEFTFQSRQLVPTVFETLLVSPSGTVFGIIYRSMQPAPNEAVFEVFCRRRGVFFIDVACEVIT